MKVPNLIVVFAFFGFVNCLMPNRTFSQIMNDSTVNFYSLSAYYDHYYDSLIQIRGAENMNGSGFKDYLRWKWFYTTRHGVEGDLGAMWESINDYYNNYHQPDNYIDESNWQFIGPLGIPLGHDSSSRKATGKGMMLSLWVSGGDHSLIYAGSHHAGLWKTTDGGDSWIPLHDNYPNIHGVNSIAVNPTNPDILYISCGSDLANFVTYSEGLFKSTDGGTSWNRIFFNVTYPNAYWWLVQRKIVLHPNIPDDIFFITYRDVYRSSDAGNSWSLVFHKNYDKWSNPPGSFGPHWGLFDFKIIPWDQETAYLAGSEIFKIDHPLGTYDTTNISDDVFYAGLNPQDYLKYDVDRTEISIQPNFPDKVWFCSYITYYLTSGDTLHYLRVVSNSKESGNYEVKYQASGEQLSANANKLEFTVSPNNEHLFYFGGINIASYDDRTSSNKLITLKSGYYPEDCWVHDDIRDLQVFTDEKGKDLLYLADDSGISWGTMFEPGQSGCNDTAWHWRHPCESGEFGLNVTEFYGIGISDLEPDLVAGGCQDLNDMIYFNDHWINFGDGDGSQLLFDPIHPNIFYFSEFQSSTLYRTDNYGADADSEKFYAMDGSSTIIPMELDPIDASVLYSGGNELLKFQGVNDFSQSVGDPEILGNFTHLISDIEVVNFGPDQRRYFISTMKSYSSDLPPSSDFTECIYFSNDGVNFNDISATLDGCRYGFISDVEVNPYDPDQIWVCAAQYSKSDESHIYQDSKVFTLSLTSPGNNWIDFSQGLPPGLPVFRIKYIPQYGMLLACTDVGIFKRNQTDLQWYPYQQNLPKKIVTDMEVNIPFRKIVAATYGRGLWESSLDEICSITEPPTYIYDHVIWTYETLAKGDIIIGHGGTLEIINCGVFMPAHARISVRPGGKLIVNGGTITSACQSPWDGIEVWGTNNCQYFSEYFGQLYLMNRAVIMNATVAISNYGAVEVAQTGGIIIADDATFKNNQIAVNYRAFKNMYQGHEYSYRSSFTKCLFINDENKFPDSEFEYFIKMDRVNGIRFYGCDFINSLDLTASHGELQDKFGTGIYSLGSQFYVDQICLNPEIAPCTQFKPSTFTGLNYGIYAMGIDPIYTISVNKSIFRDNVTGVYISGIENATVTSNDFHVNKIYSAPPVPHDTCVGLYLDYCTGFTVEENSFTQDSGYDFHNTGIVVKDAGENSNEIYNNYFSQQFEAGIMALNKNRGRDANQGLVIKCNEFAYTGPFRYDVLVIEEGTITSNSGIAEHQGSNVDETSPAGNLFSRFSHPLFMDYTNTLGRNPIIYFMHDSTSEIRVKPWHYSYNTITLSPTEWQYSKDRSCKSHLIDPDPEPDPPHLRAELDSLTLEIDTAQTELSIWVDGGSTEQLVSDVTYSTPPEAYDLYSDLILKSPYLSDTVMKESIEKEDVLDNAMVEDILVANPQAAKSAEIQETLDGRINQLTDDQRESVDQGKYAVSAKEVLESRLAWDKHCRAMILDDLTTLYKNDTLNAFSRDSLVALLNSESDPFSSYKLAFIWLNEGDSLEAWNTLNNMINLFDFNDADLELQQQYNNYAGCYFEMVDRDDPDFVEDSVSRSSLYALAGQNTCPGAYSRNMLQFFDTLIYIEPYVLPDEQVKTGASSQDNSKKPQVDNDFRIYPNPAMSYFIAEYLVQEVNVQSLELLVSDLTGQNLLLISLPGRSGHKIIDTKALKPGLYLCKFVMNGKTKKAIKLSVVQ